MKKFVLDNIAIVIGISLPIMLMIFFFIAGRTSLNNIADPAYDVVYAIDYYDNHQNSYPYNISLDNGKIVIRVTPQSMPNAPNYPKPQLYIFDHKTQSSAAIDIDFNHAIDGFVQDPDLDKINQNILSSNKTSPDGYVLDYHYEASGGGIVGELFGGQDYSGRNNYCLTKEAKCVPVKTLQPYSSYSPVTVAWITQQK